jgi:hypothetical protein
MDELAVLGIGAGAKTTSILKLFLNARTSSIVSRREYQRNHSLNLHPYQDKQWLSCYMRILVLIDTVMALTAGAGGEHGQRRMYRLMI